MHIIIREQRAEGQAGVVSEFLGVVQLSQIFVFCSHNVRAKNRTKCCPFFCSKISSKTQHRDGFLPLVVFEGQNSRKFFGQIFVAILVVFEAQNSHDFCWSISPIRWMFTRVFFLKMCPVQFWLVILTDFARIFFQRHSPGCGASCCWRGKRLEHKTLAILS